MSSTHTQIKPLRPLVVPGLLMALVAALAMFLKPLGAVDGTITELVGRLPESWMPAFSFLTFLGSAPVLIAVVLIVAGVELLRRRWMRAASIALSLLAFPVYGGLKLLVHRARPVTEFVATQGLHDFSFPSGHTTGSATVYGLVGLLVTSRLPRPWSRLAGGAFLVFIGLIGLSRVYLGAHFPTDVLGGWLVALTLVSLIRSFTLVVAESRHEPEETAIEDTTEGVGR